MKDSKLDKGNSKNHKSWNVEVVLIVVCLLIIIPMMIYAVIPTNNRCIAKEHPPKFHYNQKVTITKGFYKGSKGTLISTHLKQVDEVCVRYYDGWFTLNDSSTSATIRAKEGQISPTKD